MAQLQKVIERIDVLEHSIRTLDALVSDLSDRIREVREEMRGDRVDEEYVAPEYRQDPKVSHQQV